MLDEDAELLIVAHQRSADAASVLDTGAAQLALRIGEVADTRRIALDIALFGGLSDAQYGLPPLVAISRNGRPAVLYRLASLIFYQYHGLGVMGQREDVFWQLHTVVAGIERAGAASCRDIDRQEVPPRIGLAVAAVVCRSLIVFILYHYRCHTGLPPLSRVAAPNLKQPASIDLAVLSQLQLIYRVLIVILYDDFLKQIITLGVDAR